MMPVSEPIFLQNTDIFKKWMKVKGRVRNPRSDGDFGGKENMILNLTDKSCVAGQRRIHALQGGGKGLHGKYIKNLTWCGVEKRSGIALVETNAKCTCMTCQRIIKEFEIKHKLNGR